MSKSFYAIIGLISLALGSIGTVIPMLPTVPFLMLSSYAFARSSTRLNTWFKNNHFYQKNLQNFVDHKAMTLKVKVKIMTMVTLLMTIGFIMMRSKGVVSGCMVIMIVWVFHVIYFTFGIRTIRDKTQR